MENPAGDRQAIGADGAFPVEFTRVTADTIGGEPGRFVGSVWGDFDNDGLVDLVRVDQAKAAVFTTIETSVAAVLHRFRIASRSRIRRRC